jgi:hypothetical protein
MGIVLRQYPVTDEPHFSCCLRCPVVFDHRDPSGAPGEDVDQALKGLLGLWDPSGQQGVTLSASRPLSAGQRCQGASPSRVKA